MNPAEFLTISSAVVPEREALISGDGRRRLTYAAMSARVNRLAHSLRALGVGPGRRLAVMATNSPALVEVYYACARLGGRFVPLNYRVKREEAAFMLAAAEPSVVLADERYLDLIDSARPGLSQLREVAVLDGERSGLPTLEGLIAAGSDVELTLEVDDEAPSLLLFTSGTTAQPKGVELSSRSLSLYVMNTMGPADPAAALEKTLVSVGIYHIAGFTSILSSIWGGRSLVLLPQFDAGAWLAAVERERITHAFVVPTMLKRLMDEPDFDSHDLASLQLLTYGAAPMPLEVVRSAIDAFSCGLMNAYGQTESTSALTYLGPEDHRLDGPPAADEKKRRRLRSVGRPMGDVELSIRDPAGNSADASLAAGIEGEVWARSARVMQDYLNQADATAAAVSDGWLHTGDYGYLDDEGYLFITGRVKELIIRGGENISAGEIEAVLQSHPVVAEAAAIGVPDPEWGEVVKAVVVAAESRATDAALRTELRAFCRERLASFKMPAFIAFVTALPRNSMGKVLKSDLRRDHGSADDG